MCCLDGNLWRIHADVITTSSNDVIHSFMVNATMATTESPEVVVAHATVGYIEYGKRSDAWSIWFKLRHDII